MALAKAWSFSALSDYETCPMRIKLKSEKAPVLEQEENRGTVIHKEAENFIKGLIEFPASLKKFRPEFEQTRERFAEGLVQIEQPWGFTREWLECGYFDDNIWLRVQIDQMESDLNEPAVMHVTDWKTGKSFGNDVMHIQQLQLYAVAVFMRYPHIQTVDAADMYLDEGKMRRKAYHRDAKFDQHFEKWSQRAEKMLADAEGKPKPNRMTCRFCRYGVENGSAACAYAVPWS